MDEKPIIESIATPIIEKIAEPLVEKIAAPLAEKISMPLVEKIAAPLAEKIAEPLAEKIAEPLAGKIAVPVIEKFASPVIERIAVLETKVDDMRGRQDKFFEVLDQHIVDESENDQRLQSGMEHLTVSLDQTNVSLKELSVVVSGVNIKQVKIDTVWTTLSKIGTVIVIVVGALWGIWTFVVEHSVHIDDKVHQTLSLPK